MHIGLHRSEVVFVQFRLGMKLHWKWATHYSFAKVEMSQCFFRAELPGRIKVSGTVKTLRLYGS